MFQELLMMELKYFKIYTTNLFYLFPYVIHNWNSEINIFWNFYENQSQILCYAVLTMRIFHLH